MSMLKNLISEAPKSAVGSYLGLSWGIVNQIRSKGASQAQIAVNIPGNKEFAAYRGPISFNSEELGLESVVLFKNDGHSCWLSGQDEAGQAAFEEVFNLLHRGLETSEDLKKFRASAVFSFGEEA